MEGEMDTTQKKAPMTDEERMELAEKLDRELDEFIDSREKRPYTEGWQEDRWQEEMEKHPFFMTKSPEAGEQLSPLLEGIQQLKYDESDNSPEELAATYKEDGNFHFKCKKYHVAVMSYTEGLRQKCNDTALNAQLHNNRAAAHFFLKNYRSCLNDCQAALNLQPSYPKAQSRAAQCCHNLGLFDDCIKLCDETLLATPADKEALALRAKAINSKKLNDRNVRKQAVAKHKNELEEQKLLCAIKERGIRMKGHARTALSLGALAPQCAEGIHHHVYLTDGRLVWPVLLFYPEYLTTDFIQNFHEDSTFLSQLIVVFETKPEWDVEDKYDPNRLHVYFEDSRTGRMCLVELNKTLSDALVDSRFILRGGTPSFVVFVADSEAEQRMLNA